MLSNSIIAGNYENLKNKSDSLETYNYLKSNKNKKVHNLTDNQGSGNKLYFVGKFYKRYLGIYVDYIDNKNYEIKQFRIIHK